MNVMEKCGVLDIHGFVFIAASDKAVRSAFQLRSG